jgi:SNF2 family DNA or RNA helicase
MTLEIRLYQQEGAYTLFHQRRMILGDEMGIGKTVQAIQAMRTLHTVGELNSCLIVCPGSALYVWQGELEKWWSEFAPRFTIIEGNQARRDKYWLHPATADRKNFGICTYEVLKQDFKRGVAVMHCHLLIADEAHKFKNHKTQNFKTMKKINSVYAYLLTGTPASRGPQDIWALLNICAPRVWTSYWGFLNEYCITSQGLWGGLEIIGTKNMPQLKEKIKPYFLRRTKKEVLAELPPKTRAMLPVAMSPKQSRLYEVLREEMVVNLKEIYDRGDFQNPIIVSDVLAKITRLRQLLCCPKLIDPELEYGGALETLVDIIQDMDDRHLVIFTPFPSAYNHIIDYFAANNIGNVYTLKGGMNLKEFTRNIEEFKSKRGIMLASIEHAQGYSLETASTAYFLGYSWRPDSNYQAEDRLHRLTSVNPVNIYYLQHRGTVDDRVLEVLNTKQTNVDAFLKADAPSIKNLLEFLT